MVTSYLAVGVDIGGTKIAFAISDRQGNVVAEHRLPTLPQEGESAVLARIAAGITFLLEQSPHPVAGIGIGCPGYVDPTTGVAQNAVNLNWREVPLAATVRGQIPGDLPVWVENDVKTAALGELYFGVAKGYRDFVYLAIGTGIGGAAVVNGEVMRGVRFGAMEVGHIVYNPAGRLCACGQRGCVETVVSGIGMLAELEARRSLYPDSPLACMESPTTTDLIQAARLGDALAGTVIAEARRWLAEVVAWCAGLLNPESIVIGGGMGRAASDLLLPGLLDTVAQRTLPAVHQGLRLELSQVTNSAVSAASLVWHRLR
jgi:glucokinase